ncbi:MAG: hypothetical protein HC896_06315 [Bacteroidales bacterium]|nr:hypothetical protein [Bacteroidales bacterium]
MNTSDLGQQRYVTSFSGSEFFLKDHQVHDQKILPAVVYLEMARAAVEEAIPAKPASTVLELQNVVWVQPIAVEAQKEISVALFAPNAGTNLNEPINFEIYSSDAETETIHCQGQAIFIQQPAMDRVDLAQLKDQMKNGRIDASGIYPVLKRWGLSSARLIKASALSIKAMARRSLHYICQLPLSQAWVTICCTRV